MVRAAICGAKSLLNLANRPTAAADFCSMFRKSPQRPMIENASDFGGHRFSCHLLQSAVGASSRLARTRQVA
jgi:hypothetical protein